jgi:long-chain acyl-CoA synthetase
MPIALKVGKANVEGRRVSLVACLLYQLVDWVLPRRSGTNWVHRENSARRVAAHGTDTWPSSLLGVSLRQVYGSTEGGMISGHQADEIRPTTVGPPLPGVEVRVAADGEFLIRSPYLFAGYHKNAEAYREVVKDDWWHSGDAGTINEQGHLIYMDRVKELAFLSSGERYSPQWIESSLRFSPYLKDSITIGEAREYVTAILLILRTWCLKLITPPRPLRTFSKPEVGRLVRQDVDLSIANVAITCR